MTTISVLIADDHQMVREGIKLLLEREPDLRVVAEASEGLSVPSLVEDAKPDVLLLDLSLPGLNGLEVIGHVRQRTPGVRTIIVADSAAESHVLRALRGGAMGYVLKESGIAALIEAIREVYAGRRYLASPLCERAIEAYVTRGACGSSEPYDLLSAREREVLNMVAEGMSSARVADYLGISVRTVENHRANLMQKLGLRNQSDLVRYAVANGIVQPGRPALNGAL